MFHTQLDPQAICARAAASKRLEIQAEAVRHASDPLQLRNARRGTRFTALLRTGHVIEGFLMLAPVFRDENDVLCGTVSFKEEPNQLGLCHVAARDIDSVELH